MQCPQCKAEVAPDDRFCGECGAPNTGTKGSPTAQALPEQPPLQQGRYAAEISRNNPGCLIFLVDQSGSMEEAIAGGSGEPKKKVVADAINRLLYNTVLRCAKEDGVRPYFDIGVWTYGGIGEVRAAFDTPLVSISQIANQPKRTEMRRRRVPDGAGGTFDEEFQFPVWLDPKANGKTPMQGAFQALRQPLQNWLARHRDSFPPVIINLTDGAFTDGHPRPVVHELMRLATADGNVLIFNCHISKQPGMAVTFPDDRQAQAFEGLAQELYLLSSNLPAPIRRQAQAKGYSVGEQARGYVFNADLVTMIDFLDIGTRTIQVRVEKK